MSEMRYSNTKILIVTRYCRVITAVVPSLCLRSESAPRTIGSTDLERTYNGPITDLKRTYNGTASEGVESSRRISLKPVFRLGDGFGMLFAFYIVFRRFSSIQNKANQPEINAFCYVIETISRLYISPISL